MDTLERLFGSPVRAKLLKLFLMNPEASFAVAGGSRQAQVRPVQFSAEARRLAKVGVVRASGRRAKTFSANRDYPFFRELRALMLKSAPHAAGPLAVRIKRLGNVKLAVLTGVFIDSPTSRVDLLLVGDGLRKSRLKLLIQWLEARVGKELAYVAMSTSEFKYRMDMYDRFVRDILEFPHETIVNKLGV